MLVLSLLLKHKKVQKMSSKNKRYTPKSTPSSEPAPFGSITLEWDKGTLVYARQSTLNQRIKNLAAAEIQTEKLLEFAYQRGAPQNDQTVLFDENMITGRLRNASGRLRIDEREGLSALCERIEKDEGKVVVTFMIDRLFRDETLVGPATFMTLCREHHVKVVLFTGMIYDFELEPHRMQFIIESMSAASYLTMMHDRLYGGKMHLSREGLYDGRPIAVGYLVDRRKLLPDGSPNSGYKRYMVYEPHAQVVQWLFRRFYELGGEISVLCREVEQTNAGYIFPPFPPETDALHLKKISIGERDSHRRWKSPDTRGYRIGKSGILSILTNSDYIGEWHSEGHIVQTDNHPAIISRELFEFARSILLTPTPRHSTRIRGPKHELLGCLDGILTSAIGPVYLTVFQSRGKEMATYVIKELNNLTGHRTRFSLPAYHLEHAVVERMRWHIEQTSDFQKWKSDASKAQQKEDLRRTRIHEQLQHTIKRMDEIAETISHLKLAALIERQEQEYAQLLHHKEDLEKALATPLPIAKGASIWTMRDVIQRLRDPHEWYKLPLDRQKLLMKTFIVKAKVDHAAPHWMQLDMEWIDPEWGPETLYLYRRLSPPIRWNAEENTWLRNYYQSVSRDEMVRHFPERNWDAIKKRARDMGMYRGYADRERGEIDSMWSWEDVVFLQAHSEIQMQEGDITVDYCMYWSASAPSSLAPFLAFGR
jgi:DNA invertase Pin-like site-specific DNA recombinase